MPTSLVTSEMFWASFCRKSFFKIYRQLIRKKTFCYYHSQAKPKRFQLLAQVITCNLRLSRDFMAMFFSLYVVLQPKAIDFRTSYVVIQPKAINFKTFYVVIQPKTIDFQTFYVVI